MTEFPCKATCGYPEPEQTFECPVCDRTVCHCNGGCDPDGICDDCLLVLSQDNPSRAELEAVRHG